MRIVIETVPHNEQRYDTLGDWQWAGPEELVIRVSEELAQDHLLLPGLGFFFFFLVGLHEMVEAVLCRNDNITELDVDNWDIAAGKIGITNPGAEMAAPYHLQHGDAEIIERLACRMLAIDWSEYEAVIEDVPEYKPAAPAAGEESR